MFNVQDLQEEVPLCLPLQVVLHLQQFLLPALQKSILEQIIARKYILHNTKSLPHTHMLFTCTLLYMIILADQQKKHGKPLLINRKHVFIVDPLIVIHFYTKLKFSPDKKKFDSL